MSDQSKMLDQRYSDPSQSPNTGFSSTNDSGPSNPSSTDPDYYRYQPAIATRPELRNRQSSNYAQATAAALQGSAPTESQPMAESGERPVPGRSMSYSKDDQKKMMHDRYMKEKEVTAAGGAPKSPGIGNSEMMGREFGFTSTG